VGWVFAWLIVSPPTVSSASAPQNDLCGGAFVIPGAGPFPFLTPPTNITGATITGDPAIPSFYQGLLIRSVWYRFTPEVSATYTLSTCAGPDATTTTADTVMALYTSAAGCNGPFVMDGDLNDQACDEQAELTRQLLADTSYYLVIWKFCDNCVEDGLNNVEVLVTRTFPPENDLCNGAVPVLQNPGSLNFLPLVGTTVGARDDYRIANTNGFGGIDQVPSAAPGRDVVYSFTAPDAGEYSFKVTDYDAAQNLVLYVAASCPAGSPGLVNPVGAANRSTFNSAEQVLCLPLAAGQQVFAFVDDDQTNNPGSSFIFEVTRCLREHEPNDSPADAAVLSCGVEGSISSLVDRDFFALGNYPFGWRAFAMVDGGAAKDAADFDLRLTTFSDTVEYDDEDNDLAFGSKSPNLAGTPLLGTPSFLFVNYNFRAPSKSEPYRVYAVVQPPPGNATPESEPNDSRATANSSEDNYFLGRLDNSLDIDLYTFNVTEGDLIFLSLDTDPHRTNSLINARLELLRADGMPVAIVNDGAFASSDGTNISRDTLTGTSPSSPGEALVYRSLEEGTFFASVSLAAGSPGAGAYLLSISKNCRIGSDGASHPPVLTNVSIPSVAAVGLPVTLKGTIWELDTGAAPTLMVRWGDGTTNTVDYAGSGRIDFSLPHTFTALANNLEIVLEVRDRSGGSAITTVNVRVRSFVQPARFTSIERLGNGHIRLELSGSPNEDYRIEQREPLGPWSVLGTRTADATGQIVIEDPLPTASSRIYRAVAD
jgi:hypothetical protein